jgi:hypothetical protein
VEPTPRGKAAHERKKAMFEAVHQFKELPKRRCACFQLCDLNDASLQAIAQKAEVLGECHESTGWFRRRIMRHFTTILRQRFEPLAPAGSVSATTAAGMCSRPGRFLDLLWPPVPPPRCL